MNELGPINFIVAKLYQATYHREYGVVSRGNAHWQNRSLQGLNNVMQSYIYIYLKSVTQEAFEEDCYFCFLSYRFLVHGTRIRPLKEQTMRFLKHPSKFHIFWPSCHTSIKMQRAKFVYQLYYCGYKSSWDWFYGFKGNMIPQGMDDKDLVRGGGKQGIISLGGRLADTPFFLPVSSRCGRTYCVHQAHHVPRLAAALLLFKALIGRH